MMEETEQKGTAGSKTYRPSAIRRRLSRSLARMRHRVRWDYLNNPRSSRLLHEQGSALSDPQRRAVTELRSRGIAFATAAELGVEGTAAYSQVQALVGEFARSATVRDRIAQFPAEFERRKLSGDDYMVKMYPEEPTLAWDNPFLQLGISTPVLNVVNSYLGMFAKLIYTDAWHTIPIDIGRRIGSQSWHRDPEDRKMVKVYLYHADADEGSGPMEYVPGSMMGGPLYKKWKWRPLKSHGERYPGEAEFDRVLPGVERVLCVGSAGTFIFCDTCGLHRGGIARTSPRVLATWTFVTPASLSLTSRRRFVVDYGGPVPAMSPAARFALLETGES